MLRVLKSHETDLFTVGNPSAISSKMRSGEVCLQFFLLFLGILTCSSQTINYSEICNNTDECADHRYECRPDENNVYRCLCDRFHAWNEYTGCIQIYNVSYIIQNTHVKVTDRRERYDKEVEKLMRAQLIAGSFVLGMVLFAFLAVSTFCIYIRKRDIALSNTIADMRVGIQSKRAGRPSSPQLSTTLV